MEKLIYKICPQELWDQAKQDGVFRGAPIDISDGFIHYSTAGQVAETAEKHFTGQENLILLAVDSEQLGPKLRYEVSRGGALFPHLYAEMPLDAVLWEKPLENDPDGIPIIPDLGQ